MAFEYEVRIPKSNFAAGTSGANAGLDIDFALPETTRGTGGNARNLVRSIALVAQDNHSFELWAYASSNRNLGAAGSSDASKFLGKWKFAATDGNQRSDDSNGFFYYYIDGNDIPVRDDDAAASGGGNTGKLHLTLIDRTGALPANHNLTIELRLAPSSQFP